MKKKYLFFFFLSMLARDSVAQHLDFFHYISLSEYQANDVKQTRDGGYLLAGGYHGVNGGDYILLKTDSAGNEQWTYTNNRFNGLDGSNMIFSMIISDGYVYLAGHIQQYFGTPEQIYIVKLDSLLNKIWEIQDTGLGGITEATKIKLTSDKNLIITGTTGIDTVNQIYSAKIDTAGNFIWKHFFSNHTSAYGLDILDRNSDEFIVCGLYRTFNNSFIDTSASIIFDFDSTGNINWYNEYPDTIINGLSSLLISKDENIYCGQYYAPMYANSGNPNSSILKFDSTGLLIYRKEFENADAFYAGIAEKNDSGFIACHDFSDIIFLNNSGDSTGSLHLSTAFPLKNIIIDSNNKGVIVGNCQLQVGQPFFSYLFRVEDSSFNYIAEESLKSMITIFPSPSDGNVTIANGLNISHEFDLIDVNGKVIDSFKLQNISAFNFNFLSNGIYFLRFKLIDNSCIQKKLTIIK